MLIFTPLCIQFITKLLSDASSYTETWGILRSKIGLMYHFQSSRWSNVEVGPRFSSAIPLTGY